MKAKDNNTLWWFYPVKNECREEADRIDARYSDYYVDITTRQYHIFETTDAIKSVRQVDLDNGLMADLVLDHRKAQVFQHLEIG